MEFLFAESFYMYINGFFVWFDNNYVRTFWVKTKPLIKYIAREIVLNAIQEKHQSMRTSLYHATNGECHIPVT